MAVDSRNKRASAVQILQPFGLAPLTPDGTIGTNDRLHIAWLYSGIAAETPATVTVDWTLQPRDLTWTLEDRDLTWTLQPRDLTWTIEAK